MAKNKRAGLTKICLVVSLKNLEPLPCCKNCRCRWTSNLLLLNHLTIWHASWENRPKVFVIVIPKEGWARVAASILLWVWQQLFRIWVFWLRRSYSLKVGVIPKEGWAPWPCPSFFWYVNDKGLTVCFLVTRVIYGQRFMAGDRSRCFEEYNMSLYQIGLSEFVRCKPWFLVINTCKDGSC